MGVGEGNAKEEMKTERWLSVTERTTHNVMGLC